MRDARRLFWVESVVGAAGVVLALLTLVWRDWIELVLRVDPDAGSGSLEWAIAVGALAVAVVAGMLARRHRHRLAPAR